jgi:flagellar biosynthesis protein FlhG
VKPLADQDHYEILETRRDATDEEIERAYRLAQATYAEDSLAGYSVFGEGDATALRDRIEVAYRVLSDPQERREYDATLGAPAGFPALAVPAPGGPPVGPPGAAFEEESGEVDGPRLRRERLRRGMELEQIAGATKVNPLYLRFLEEERFDDLPAPVYVRGFVSLYASCMGLDGREAAASYMRCYEQRHSGARRARFFDR